MESFKKSYHDRDSEIVKLKILGIPIWLHTLTAVREEEMRIRSIPTSYQKNSINNLITHAAVHDSLLNDYRKRRAELVSRARARATYGPRASLIGA